MNMCSNCSNNNVLGNNVNSFNNPNLINAATTLAVENNRMEFILVVFNNEMSDCGEIGQKIKPVSAIDTGN